MNRFHQESGQRSSMAAYGVLSAISGFALFVAICILAAVPKTCYAEPVSISGAGATFPMPVFEKWIETYNKSKKAEIKYRGIGSGGGIAHIKAKAVDFGASDSPLKPEDLDQEGLFQFPIIMGGVVPVVHLKSVPKGRLKLTPGVLADIYLGNIRMWNDPRIKAINSDLSLPDQEIVVVHRADGSGTTHIFTSYLSNVSKEWKEKKGANKEISWPTGVGGKGNPGVAGLVKRLEGSIGYVEYTYAVSSDLACVQLQNSSGDFVKPSTGSFQAAADKADWQNAAGFVIDLTNQPGNKTWPIVGVAYILLQKEQPDAVKADALLTFFDWAYTKGNSTAERLHYVPMPPKVVALVKQQWIDQIKAEGRQFWQKSEQAAAAEEE